jgi:hypothetical protein
MDGMTVFGFGRAGPLPTGRRLSLSRIAQRVRGRLGLTTPTSALLSRVPARLIIGFVEARDFEGVKTGIDHICRGAVDPGEAGRQT